MELELMLAIGFYGHHYSEIRSQHTSRHAVLVRMG